MTDHTVRLYALAVAVLVFFLAWAAVAARPWATSTASAPKQDPRLAALVAKEKRVRAETLAVRKVLARRKAAAAAAVATPQPSVRVVTLPPLTITRTS
jgi:hypothetical protein